MKIGVKIRDVKIGEPASRIGEMIGDGRCEDRCKDRR